MNSATTTLLQCDEQPNCQRAGRAAAAHVSPGPRGTRPIGTGVARTGHWPGGGAALGLPRPAPSGVGTVSTSRPAARFISSTPRSRGGADKAVRPYVSIDRSGEPPGGASVGPLRVGDGADVAARP